MTTDARVGTTVGDYTIEALLGRGGMGVVYRARHVTDGRVVALKLMLPELSANEDFRDRFIREAEFGPALDHPNIVPVYETGEVAGELFIAMHLVEGWDLKALIKRDGPLAPRRVLSILVQAASALDAAHEMVVVHRDVKPQNIMIAPGEEPDERDLVFVTDFGLIRPVASESTASRSGQIFGSIQYMAPEQIEGLPADGRADIYSLACVAYECLTGHIPFDRPNEIGAIWAHIHEDPPRASDARPELPRGIDDVIRQAMAKHPDDRYLTCGEFVSALKTGLKKQRRQLVPTPLRPLVKRVTRPKTEREIWAPNFFPELSRVRKLTNRTDWRQVAATTAVLLVLPAAVAQFAHPQGVVGAATDVGDAVTSLVPGSDEDRVEPEQRSNPLPQARKGPRERLWANLAAEAPSGSGVGSATTRQDAPDASRTPRNRGPRAVATTDPLADTKIAFATWRHAGSNKSVTGGEIYLMNGDGTGLKRLTWTDPAQQESSPAISPDGDRVVFQRTLDVDNMDLFLVDSDGSATTRLTQTSACEYWPSWSPDGTEILFARTGSCLSGGNSDLWLLNLETGIERNLTSSPQDDDWGGVWSPDGRRIVFTSDNALYMMDRAGRRIHALGSETGPTPGWDPDWCRGGSIVFARRTGIWRLDLDTRKTQQLTANTAQYGDDSPSCAPDGQKVIFETFRDGHWQLYMMDADGGNEINVTRSEFGEHHPDWQANP